MSDLNNMLDDEKESFQPEAAVEAATEESQPTPQGGDTESEYFFDEGEADQSNAANDEEQKILKQRAKFAKLKSQKRAEVEAREKAERENAELLARLAALESSVGDVTRGPKPTLESCGYDEETFEQAYDKWRSHGTTKSAVKNTEQPVNNQQQAVNPVNDEADFYHHLKSTELKEKLTDFDEQASKVQSKINSVTGNQQNTEMFMQNMRAIAHRRGIDIAKAEYALGRSDVLFEKLKATRDQYDIEDVLREAAGKIQTRERKAPESQPTPTIGGGGTIDNTAAGVEKLRQKWQDSGSIKDYQAYKAARKQSQTK